MLALLLFMSLSARFSGTATRRCLLEEVSTVVSTFRRLSYRRISCWTAFRLLDARSSSPYASSAIRFGNPEAVGVVCSCGVVAVPSFAPSSSRLTPDDSADCDCGPVPSSSTLPFFRFLFVLPLGLPTFLSPLAGSFS